MALSLLGSSISVADDELTLARLEFWIPPDRVTAFSEVYEKQVAPLLHRHGLVASDIQSRTTIDSVYSRIFVWDTVDQFKADWAALQRDSTWVQTMRHLGSARSPQDITINRHAFHLYTWPAIVDSTVITGPGFSQGLWRTYGVPDGLSDSRICALAVDGQGQILVGSTTLERYDGHTFSRFPIDSRITAIAVDGQSIWVGTSDGLVQYDGHRFTRFTTADGLAQNNVGNILVDRRHNVWIGTGNKYAFFKGGGGLTRWDGTIFKIFTTADGLADNTVYTVLEDHQGTLWCGTRNGLSRFDGTTWQSFSTTDGLPHDSVYRLIEDNESHLWLGTLGGGVARYDGRKFTTFTNEHGLASNNVYSTVKDLDGNLWFGTSTGLSRWDGKTFTNFGTEDGMGNNLALSLAIDHNGHLWAGSIGTGISRWNGRQFVHYTAIDSLPNVVIHSIAEDRRGHLWFGSSGSISRYDGEHFTHFTNEQIPNFNHDVKSIIEDDTGHLWFALFGGGTLRYDGQTFTRFTADDGLGSNSVWSIAKDQAGHLWFVTMGNGVTRYDGLLFEIFRAGEWFFTVYSDRRDQIWLTSGNRPALRYDGLQFSDVNLPESELGDFPPLGTFEDRHGGFWFGGWSDGMVRYDGQTSEAFTPADGLGHGFFLSAIEDEQNHIWMTTYGGGISRFDGRVFQTMSRRDGLLSNAVQQVYQDRSGMVWIATESGITRYRPPTMLPGVDLIDVTTDQRQGPLSEVSMSSSQTFVAFEFQGKSFTTLPDQFAYIYRLLGYDEEWQTTRKKRVEYTDLGIGEYTFQVKSVDLDLNYSQEPASTKLVVHLPYNELALWLILGLALSGLVITTRYGIQRSRERNQVRKQLVQELEEELQTAHEMQMGLMPTEAPKIQGVDIAGRCIPASQVGGDFFQYFAISDCSIAISLADVTGHAMEAAIPVVMFSGILDAQMETGHTLEDLFAKLNRSLHRNLDKRTFICFTMGELDTRSKKFRLSNGGCPYPYHYRAATSDIVELQVDSYPLGVRPETMYPVIETQLEAGDRILFCSDGIIEASNSAEEMFGFERTADTILESCKQNLTTSQLIDHLINTVRSFTGEVPQGDDQTIVVLAIND